MSAYTRRTHSKYTFCKFLDVLGIKKSILKDMVEVMTRFFGLPNFALRKTVIVDKKTPHKKK